jgi:hypothetical protein
MNVVLPELKLLTSLIKKECLFGEYISIEDSKIRSLGLPENINHLLDTILIVFACTQIMELMNRKTVSIL